MLPARWNWQQYSDLNPDLQAICTDEDKARQHWLESGYQEGRLYHPEQLVVTAEFGFELLIYTCYYYWLHRRGLLFQHSITTYPGMRVFYWFLPPSRVIELERPRSGHRRPSLFLHNSHEHVRNLNYKYWTAIPLRVRYYSFAHRLALPETTKPLLIINNKYNSEWGGAPVNYIPVATLMHLVHLLSPHYQLIYSRPVGGERGFSWDHNRLVSGFHDYDALPASVWRLHELHEQYAPHLNYNEFKVLIYCRAKCYIGVQGGSSHFTAFFGGRQVILHVRGSELRSGAYEGWYKRLCPRLPLKLKVVRQSTELAVATREMFLPVSLE